MVRSIRPHHKDPQSLQGARYKDQLWYRGDHLILTADKLRWLSSILWTPNCMTIPFFSFTESIHNKCNLKTPNKTTLYQNTYDRLHKFNRIIWRFSNTLAYSKSVLVMIHCCQIYKATRYKPIYQAIDFTAISPIDQVCDNSGKKIFFLFNNRDHLDP